MEKALERGEEFHEMRDVIARYDTLTATHEVHSHCQFLFQQQDLSAQKHVNRTRKQ